MRVTVLGASGRTGLTLVSQALEASYKVVAFVRDRSKLGIEHERLTVIEGDATDLASLERAVAGADAVLSGLGPVKGRDPRLMPRAAAAVVDAMRNEAVRRLVWLTGAGVRDEGDPRSIVRSAIRGLMRIVSRAGLESSDAAYRTIVASGLDWTVARVPRLKAARASTISVRSRLRPAPSRPPEPTWPRGC